MQVQSVELVASHFGDESLQLVKRNECTGWVDHQFTYVSARSVLDGELRNGVDTLLIARTKKNLVESHQSPEHAARSLALDVHALRVYSKSVSLVVVERRVEGENKLQATLTTVHDVADTTSKHLASTLHLIVQYIIILLVKQYIPGCLHVQRLSTLLNGQGLRHWGEAQRRIAHFLCHLRLGIEAAPACCLHISLLAALRNDELNAAWLYTIE